MRNIIVWNALLLKVFLLSLLFYISLALVPVFFLIICKDEGFNRIVLWSLGMLLVTALRKVALDHRVPKKECHF